MLTKVSSEPALRYYILYVDNLVLVFAGYVLRTALAGHSHQGSIVESTSGRHVSGPSARA